MTAVDAILARLLTLHPKRIDLSLDRMWRILAALGHPERALPPVIHVAGTNGKGSTIAFMRAMLEAAGLRVHVYTSPNLVRINERYRIAGKLVTDAALAEALAECERVNGDAPITVFEIETAAALVLFSRHPADVLLLEVGLGGRLDATNVTERPLVSVITPISIDHVEFLGDTLEKIAAEKAAIMRRDVPAVIGRQPEGPLAVITRHADEVGAPLHVLGQEWIAGEERGRLVYQDARGLIDLPAPRLFGRHQFDNAGTAIAALRVSGLTLGRDLDLSRRFPSGIALNGKMFSGQADVAQLDQTLEARAFEAGILKADWPARMQRLTAGKLQALLPRDSELWLDGGHNADGGRAAAAALADLEDRVSRPVVLIAGMLSTKDSAGFLRNFAGLARRLIAIPIRQDKTLSAQALAASATGVGIPSEAADGIETALARVRELELAPAPRILITGSLYLAGEVLAANGTLPG